MNLSLERIKVLDSHTGGEPTRLVLEGFPDLGNGSMAERLEILKNRFDHFRKAVILEPRGNDVLVGALLCSPTNPEATAGVIFFNNKGYLGMCGHGTIGLMASLLHLQKVEAGEHLIETPVGDIRTTLHEDGSVSLKNVPAYRYRKAVSVDVPEWGRVTGDIAWGGNWFFLVNQHFLDIDLKNAVQLSDITLKIMAALKAAGITGANDEEIDHVELFQSTPTANSRSFVMCPGGAYDRSPCGTGTSAKVATLAEDDLLAEGDIWIQESVIGSQFQASYQREGEKIIPIIRGRAYISGENTLLLDPADPFRYGISTDCDNPS